MAKSETIVLSDGEEIRSRLIISINEARYSIFVAVAFFTDKGIADALVKAYKRGLNVQVVVSNAQMNSFVKAILANNGVDLYQVEDSLMHAKFMVVDEDKVINGSYNYTLRASKENKEVVNITTGKEVSDYKNIFMDLIEGLTPVPPEAEKNTYDKKIEVDQGVFADRLESVVFATLDDHNKDTVHKLGVDEASSSMGSPEIFMSRISQYSQSYRDKLVRDDSTKALIVGRLQNMGADEKNKLSQAFKEWNEIESEKLQYDLSQVEVQKGLVLSKLEDTKEEGVKIETEIKAYELKIEQHRDSIDELKMNSQTISFLRFGNILRIVLLLFICAILSIFFASSLYNLLSLEDIVQNYIEFGGETMPKGFPIYLDILDKLKSTYGTAGYAALALFILPLVISNIGLLAPKLNKILTTIISVVFGMIFIDVIVAVKISETLQESFNMLYPSEAEVFTVGSAFKKGDIFLVFIFGFFPLLVSHFLFSALSDAYVNSSAELSDAENHKRMKFIKRKVGELEEKLIPIRAKQESVQHEVLNYESDIEALSNQKSDLDKVFQSNKDAKRDEIRMEESKIDNLVGRYIAMIERGDKLILRKATESVATTYMHGFKSYIIDYYSERVSQEKIRLIQAKFDSWVSNNFDS